MAYIITEPTPPNVFIQQASPPVFIQPAPAPVYIEQALPTVVVQPAHQPGVAMAQNPAPVVFSRPMKDIPASVKCNLCQQQVITMIEPVNGLITWIISGVLFFFGIWPFCLIPFCTKCCRDIKHTCPNCQNVIHIHKRM